MLDASSFFLQCFRLNECYNRGVNSTPNNDEVRGRSQSSRLTALKSREKEALQNFFFFLGKKEPDLFTDEVKEIIFPPHFFACTNQLNVRFRNPVSTASSCTSSFSVNETDFHNLIKNRRESSSLVSYFFSRQPDS